MSNSNRELNPGEGQGEHPGTQFLPVIRRPEGHEYFFWGGVPISKRALSAPHFILLGQPKSGKTWSIRMLMQSALGGNPAPRHRAVVFDPKREALPVLLGMGIPLDRLVVMHPFDSRATAWDIAADLADKASIRQFAETLCPTTGGAKDPYWTKAAARLLEGGIHGIIHRQGKEWSLWDVVELMASPEALSDCLEETNFGRRRKRFFLDQGKEASKGVLSTLFSNLSQYEDIAELWRDAKTKVSLKAWLQSGSILLLGSDPMRAESINPINQAIFQRISELVSSRTEEDPLDETWFFIDEAREVGKLRGLRTLMNLSRSKGARVVLGVQDKHGLSAVYGKDEALELLSAASNLGVLSLGCPETAEWASKYFGEYEAREPEVSESFSRDRKRDEVWYWPDRSSTTVRYQKKSMKAVLPQQLMRLPLATPRGGICGVFASDVIGIWSTNILPEEVVKHTSEKANVPAFVPRELGVQKALPEPAQQSLPLDDEAEKFRFRTMDGAD